MLFIFRGGRKTTQRQQLLFCRSRRIIRGSSSSWMIKTRAGFKLRNNIRQNHHQSSSSIANSSSTNNFVAGGIAWYSKKLDTHPILTKCISSGIVAATGDMICQYLTTPSSSSSSTWDIVRTGRFAVLGTFWVGPVLHYWYGALFRTFPKQVLLRVALDQFVCAPIFLTTFLSWLWLMEDWEESTQQQQQQQPEPIITTKSLPSRLQENVPSIVVANWSLWIPAQAINFYLVPVKYHVLFSNFVALAWNAYLSYSSHRISNKEEQSST